ncbi:MAG: ribosome biogenesis factor YjgA [Gammaproteobacteria bacterium]
MKSGSDHARPSKTRRKKESKALQDLGEALIQLPPSAFAAAPIPENLREAVELARNLNKHGALRRQRQYIGKLMRAIDPQPLEEFFAKRAARHQGEQRRFHQLERWRDRIIAEGEPAIDQCVAATGADPAQLRALANDARNALDTARRKQAGRLLFRYLNDLGGRNEDQPAAEGHSGHNSSDNSSDTE